MDSKGMIPVFKTLTLEGTAWTVQLMEEAEAFLNQNNYQAELKSFAQKFESSPTSFKFAIKIGGMYFTLGFFPQGKKMILLSHRGSRELLLAELYPEASDLVTILDQFKTIKDAEAPTISSLVTKKYNLVDLESDHFKAVDAQAREIAVTMAAHVNGYRKSLFEKFSDFGLNLTASFDLFRIHILKFLAILPSLDHDQSGKEVKRVLLENLRRLLEDNQKMSSKGKKDQVLPKQYSAGIALVFHLCALVPHHMLAGIVRFAVAVMAKRFIAGENMTEALKTLKGLRQTNRDATLDQLGELVVSHHEADHYQNEVLKIIEGLRTSVPQNDKNASGINRAHVSIKVSALSPVFKPHAYAFTYSQVAPRLKKILIAAHNANVFVNIDAEHYHYRNLVFDIFSQVLLETPELKNYQQTGIVVQCYLRDAAEHLDEVIELAKKRGLTMPIRLVKGAYWDAETIEAEAHGYSAPQFLNKEETDVLYRQMIYKVMNSHPHVQAAVASHNIADHAWSEALRSIHFSHIPVIEHQVLHMTYESLSHALAKMNLPVRNYMPIGGLLVGMAYLVRRIMENSSQVGILTQMRKRVDVSGFRNPNVLLDEKAAKKLIAHEHQHEDLKDSFRNIHPVRFYLREEYARFQKAEKSFRPSIGNLKFGDQLSGSVEKIHVPFEPETTLGTTKFATVADVEKAVNDLDQASAWKNDYRVRVAAILKAANLMLMDRDRLTQVIIYESGKTVLEALGDVDEAIDFLNFYAREEMKLQKAGNLTHRNLVGVIAPWNFPLAIPCGMVAGALVAGNHVILKSAEQTPMIAWELSNIFYAAGVPENVYRHLPGPGETIGKYLVESPKVEAIVFTGSKAVGEWIYKASLQKAVEHKLSYKPKVVAEMGGKNAIIVTANAELDETVSGILYAAFAHAGQKCSAASRVLVDHTIKDKLEARIKAAMADIQVGKSSDPATFVNSLIHADEKNRLQKQIKEAGVEAKNDHGKILIDRSTENFPGAVMGPAAFSVSTKLGLDRNSYACKELFGPVIHIIPFRDLDEAIKLFNTTEYALTGGIYSQSQDDIDYLLNKLYCGNLYINRPNTGARVGIEPFGGFKMSGTGPKAGSTDYVRIFHRSNLQVGEEQVRAVTFIGGATYYDDLNKEGSLKKKDHLDQKLYMLRFLEVLKNNHSTLKVQFDLKKSLSKPEEWITKTFSKIMRSGRNNTVIPGQLSFNDFKLAKREQVIVSDCDVIHEQVLLSLIAALTVSTKVTILVRDNKAYAAWLPLVNLAYLAGFKEESLRLVHLDREAFYQLLSNTTAEVFYLDTNLGDFHQWYNLILSRKTDYLPLILSNQERIEISSFEDYIMNFVLVRSLAVNIMRHGAPLALEITE